MRLSGFKRLESKLIMLPSFAAAMAFYFIVSLVPFLIVVSKLVVWLFSANLTPELAGFLRDVLPPESRLRPEAVSAAVAAGGGRGLGLVSTLAAAWTASSGLNELARAVHFVFSDSSRPHPGGWLRRAKALGLLAIWALAIGTAAVFLVLLPAARGTALRYGGGRVPPEIVGGVVRYPVAFSLMFATFVATYVFIPSPRDRPSWRAAAAGGLVASAVWMGTCLVFSFLLPRVWGVSLFRGVMSSALATLVWAYCGCWGVILGACWAAAADG